jgi:uncharacterized surface protein with fasciclin (FAS1) repeats
MRSHLVLVSALAVISSLLSDVTQAVPSAVPSCANTETFDSLRGPRQHHVSSPRHGGRRDRDNRRNRDDRRNRDESLLEMLRRDHRFSRLVEVVSRAGGNLRDDLDENNTDQTLLAPTNDAFDVMERNHGIKVEDLGHNDLSRFLRYHIIPNQALIKDDMEEGDLLETAMDNHKPLGDERSQVIRVSRQGERVVLNMNSQIIDCDMEARNGVIHVLSEVLHVPRPLGESLDMFPSRFSTHALALHLTGLVDNVDRTPRMTAMVATNEAWESMGEEELRELFHPDNRDELKRLLLKHYIPEVAYIREIAEENGLNEEECARGRYEINERRDNDESRHQVAKRRFDTWADEQVTIRVVCHGRQLRAMVDENTISFADYPADNGVTHVLTSPMTLNHRRRHDRNDRDHRRPRNPDHRDNDDDSGFGDDNDDNEADEQKNRRHNDRRNRRNRERRDRERRDRERRDRDRRHPIQW